MCGVREKSMLRVSFIELGNNELLKEKNYEIFVCIHLQLRTPPIRKTKLSSSKICAQKARNYSPRYFQNLQGL